MGSCAMSLVLLVLGMTATLPWLTRAHVEGSTNTTQCFPLQTIRDLLDTRLNGRETRLNGLDTRLNEVQSQLNGFNTLLNGLDTRLSTQQNTRQSEVNSRFNRIDSRLDGIEMAISDMKGFLQTQMEAMNKKVELALAEVQPGQDVITARPDTRPQQDVTVTEKPQAYSGCQDVLTRGQNTSGVYTISPDGNNTFNVYCEQQLDGGGWVVFQARKDGSIDFYNDWNTYKAGFGSLTGEFWLGNENIHHLTKQHNQQLKVELTSPDGAVKFADYMHFWIEGMGQAYKLTVSGYSGLSPPGDSLASNNGQKFSTKDQDNDRWGSSCANSYMGGWWYCSGCGYSNLNGVYGDTRGGKGVNWVGWKSFTVSMTATRMMLRGRP